VKPAARVTDLHTCPAHVGGPLLPPGSPDVIIGGLAAARVTDAATCEGPPDVVAQGATMVLLNGLPAARTDDPTVHGGTIVGGLSTVLIGGPTGAGAGLGTGLSLDGNPPTLIITPELCRQFRDSMARSFPGGRSQEQGSTIIRDADGNVSSFVGTGNGNSGSFSPDRNVPAGTRALGISHTHPYDATEGGMTNVSLSGGDAAYMINQGDQMIFAQSGDGQYMYMRTATTPANVDFTRTDDAQNARIGVLTSQGKSFDEASRIAARETAQRLGLAYYEGRNCKLDRVVP
jgi:uncharacterized Zn-binding protein involved in type VI secretion